MFSNAPILADAGVQAAIQMIPRLSAPAQARILAPTYNEHAAALRAAGWQIDEVTTLSALEGADLAVVVNPNNPDGRCHEREQLLQLATRVGRLVVDESFADARPDLSLAGKAGQERLIVLRSFGKFYGLAGARLGFILGANIDISALAEMAGPWPISGPAIAIGEAALSDRSWAEATVARLRADASRLDVLAQSAGWKPLGGTELFRLYDTPDAAAAQDRLARHQIWTRMFPYSERWLRLGLPGQAAEWDRFAAALRD
jgi:cobalamin biosynthetic protein CobC